MAEISQTCSWCHRLNRLLPDGGPVYCPACGHRADVSRLACDCVCCALNKLEAAARKEEQRHGH